MRVIILFGGFCCLKEGERRMKVMAQMGTELKGEGAEVVCSSEEHECGGNPLKRWLLAKQSGEIGWKDISSPSLTLSICCFSPPNQPSSMLASSSVCHFCSALTPPPPPDDCSAGCCSSSTRVRMSTRGRWEIIWFCCYEGG